KHASTLAAPVTTSAPASALSSVSSSSSSPSAAAATTTRPHNHQQMLDAKKHAEQIYTTKLADFERKQERAKPNSERRWLTTVLKSGTVADRIAALQVQVQEAPMFRLGRLDQLLALAGKKGR